jgi:hypothetical protein
MNNRPEFLIAGRVRGGAGLGNWRCAMWRMSNAQALIFIVAVVIAVALLLLS